jgi:hypothetical protein
MDIVKTLGLIELAEAEGSEIVRLTAPNGEYLYIYEVAGDAYRLVYNVRLNGSNKIFGSGIGFFKLEFALRYLADMVVKLAAADTKVLQ